MPQRFLRPAIRQSKRWNRLPWLAQSFYIRLITLVDDQGRYEADPELLRSEAFPYGCPDGTQVLLLTIADICQHLTTNDLAVFYEIGGKKYLQLTRWQERARSPSRYPAPPCEHLPASDNKCVPPKPSPIASSHKPSPSPAAAPVPTNARASVDRGCAVPQPAAALPVVPRETSSRPFIELQAAITSLYGGKPRWSHAEEAMLAEIARAPTGPAEFQAILRYRETLPPQDRARFFPQSVVKLLEKWGELLDRARISPPAAKGRTAMADIDKLVDNAKHL